MRKKMKRVLILTPYISEDHYKEIYDFVEEIRKSTGLKVGIFSSHMFKNLLKGQSLLAKHISIIKNYKKIFVDKDIDIFSQLNTGKFYDLVFYVGIMPENQKADFELAYKSKAIIAQEIFLEEIKEINFIKSVKTISKKEKFEKFSKLKKRIYKIIKKGK